MWVAEVAAALVAAKHAHRGCGVPCCAVLWYAMLCCQVVGCAVPALCHDVLCHCLRPCLCAAWHRPFDPTKATAETGAWCWVGLPKSLLINGKGNYHDCEDVYKREVGVRAGGQLLCGGCVWGAGLQVLPLSRTSHRAGNCVQECMCHALGAPCEDKPPTQPLTHAAPCRGCRRRTLLLPLQVNKTLPYRPADKPATAAAKDLLAPNACVAGQLGPTAEPAGCDVTGAAAGCVWAVAAVFCTVL